MKLLIADDEAVISRGILSLDWKSIGIDIEKPVEKIPILIENKGVDKNE